MTSPGRASNGAGRFAIRDLLALVACVAVGLGVAMRIRGRAAPGVLALAGCVLAGLLIGPAFAALRLARGGRFSSGETIGLWQSGFWFLVLAGDISGATRGFLPLAILLESVILIVSLPMLLIEPYRWQDLSAPPWTNRLGTGFALLAAAAPLAIAVCIFAWS